MLGYQPLDVACLLITGTEAMDRSWTEVIKEHPIATGLDGFRATFSSAHQVARYPETTAILGELQPDQLQNLILNLLAALQVLPAARILRANNGKILFVEILGLNSAVASDDFDLDRLYPLLKVSVDRADDSTIWKEVKNAIAETTPPPRSIASSIRQTPWLRNTSSFPN